MNPTHTARRHDDLRRFYRILGTLPGPRTLSECTGRMAWPERGVYFFQENGEYRASAGAELRVVRVGTHALKAGAQTTLWKRLSQHRGTQKTGGGNHRGSIFRLLVGTALMSRSGRSFSTWAQGNSTTAAIREGERPLERLVSDTIGDMPLLWIAITDPPSKASKRGYIERNAIALLSNYHQPPMDAPSPEWLGHHCRGEKVRRSGLWNQNHVDETYDPDFLDEMKTLATATMSE